MIKAGGVLKMIDEEKVMMESLMCLRRAGADIILTYFARQAASVLCGEKKWNEDPKNSGDSWILTLGFTLPKNSMFRISEVGQRSELGFFGEPVCIVFHF